MRGRDYLCGMSSRPAGRNVSRATSGYKGNNSGSLYIDKTLHREQTPWEITYLVVVVAYGGWEG